MSEFRCPKCGTQAPGSIAFEPAPCPACNTVMVVTDPPHADPAPGAGDGAFQNGALAPAGTLAPPSKEAPRIALRWGPMLIIAFILTTLAGLCIPGIQRVRQASARTQSTNNLKAIGLAFHGFHDANKRLPFPGGLVASTMGGGNMGDPRTGTWAYQILPYIDQMDLFNHPPTGMTANAGNQTRTIPAFLCPGRGRPGYGKTGYEAAPNAAWSDYMINGLINDPITIDGFFVSGIVTIGEPTNAIPNPNGDNRRTLVAIADGTSNTIFVGHGMIQQGDWSNPADASVDGGAVQCSDIYLQAAPPRDKATGWRGIANRLARGSNIAAPTVMLDAPDRSNPDFGIWGGPFPQGALMGMGDATVRMFPYSVNSGSSYPISKAGVGTALSFSAYLTPNGGEASQLPDCCGGPGESILPAPSSRPATPPGIVPTQTEMPPLAKGPPPVAPEREVAVISGLSRETTTTRPEVADPKPAPALADAVVGSAKAGMRKEREPGLPSGILTAGSFDDNLDPRVFHDFVAKRTKQRGLGDLPQKMVGRRLMIQVRDSDNKPVCNARVNLSAGAGQAVEVATRTDGRAVFVLSFDRLPADQDLTASVTHPTGGAPVVEKIAAGALRWDVVLPRVQGQRPRNLDLAIVVDTTGSMGGEINHLRAEIRGISAVIREKFPEVSQRFALVCYRDEGQGDEYTTRTFEFTPSLDTFHKNLSAQKAHGGGDYPEAMHRGLEDAANLRWRDSDTAGVVFLIADAPPHAQHMNKTLAAANRLRQKGVAIYPVACSGYDDACEFVMRSCAVLTGSQFLFLTDDSGVGGSHAEPKIPYYSVERLERLMTRIIASELAGERIEADPQDIIRKVGAKLGNK